MFWITAEAPMRVTFTLPEKFLGRVHKGEMLEVASPYVNQKSQAKVIMLSPVVDPASGTIEVMAELAGPTGELRPGMTANIRIENPK